jgi:hypothetical protein
MLQKSKHASGFSLLCFGRTSPIALQKEAAKVLAFWNVQPDGMVGGLSCLGEDAKRDVQI